ncbi:hypothetical protein Tco_0413095, partial [Tanacetum coccineum]
LISSRIFIFYILDMAYGSLLNMAYKSWLCVVSYEVQARIRRIFLDGYDVLECQNRFLQIYSFKLQNARLLANLHKWDDVSSNVDQPASKSIVHLSNAHCNLKDRTGEEEQSADKGNTEDEGVVGIGSNVNLIGPLTIAAGIISTTPVTTGTRRANKLSPTPLTKAKLQKLETNVPNDANYDVWLPLASVHEFSSSEGVDSVLRDGHQCIQYHRYTTIRLKSFSLLLQGPLGNLS